MTHLYGPYRKPLLQSLFSILRSPGMKKRISLLLIPFFFGLACPLLADDEMSGFSDSTPENKWVAPPPVDESDRLVKFLIQADFQHDADLRDQSFGMLDLSAKRLLDENSVMAEGLVRFRKDLSTSDAASSIDLRLARLS